MSTYQIVIRSTVVFQGLNPARLYARFLNWWVGLYAAPPRRLPPML